MSEVHAYKLYDYASVSLELTYILFIPEV